mmetsp:Transcript_42924/g.115558  ORF Transcript_42924/g.115558 Transcript_42924/m.115558 type:complete len:229 (-) Transcript_42924:1170-1856(-)
MRAPLTRTHILFFFTAGPAARFRRSARSRSGVHQPGRYTLRAHKSRLCRIVDVAHLTGRVSLLLLLRTQFGHTALQGRSRMRAACDTRRVRFRHRPSCGLLAHLFLEELLATALNHTVEVWRCLHALRVLAAWAKVVIDEVCAYLAHKRCHHLVCKGQHEVRDVLHLVVGAVEVEHPLRARIALGIRCEARYARIATTQREARALLRGGGQRCRAWVLAALCHHHEAL